MTIDCFEADLVEFDPALDRLDRMAYSEEPPEPDWALAGHSCFWGWVALPGGGQRRCPDCNVRPGVARRRLGRAVRQGRLVKPVFASSAPF